MPETSEDINALQLKWHMQRTPSERFLVGLEMMEEGRQLMIAGIKMEHPDFTDEQIRIEHLHRLRMYDTNLAWLDELGLW